MRTLAAGWAWSRQFRVPATWTAEDGPRSAAARLVAPARDTPRRWLLVWVVLLVAGGLSLATSAVRDGVDRWGVLVIPLLAALLLSDLVRARTLLRRAR